MKTVAGTTARPSTCAGAATIRAAAASPVPTAGHPRASKPRFPRLAKPIIIASSLQRLNRSKLSKRHINQLGPIPPPPISRPQTTLIRGILLSKPPDALIAHGSPSLLVASPLGPPTSDVQRIRKRVRFSGEAGTSGNGESSSGAKEQEGSERGQMMRGGEGEGVIETIFLTYSRAAYDRTPIMVDRVLNKSLALPPRMTDEWTEQEWTEEGEERTDAAAAAGRGGRWRTAQLEPYELPLCARLSAGQEPAILLPAERQMALLPAEPHHQLFLSAHPSWPSRAPQPLFDHPWPADDALSESLGSSSSSDSSSSSSSSSSQDHHPPVLAQLLPLPLPRFHPNALPDGHLSAHNLAHHQLSNLSLHHRDSADPPPSQSPSTLVPLSGFGNWSRAQLFDSCDALDGF